MPAHAVEHREKVLLGVDEEVVLVVVPLHHGVGPRAGKFYESLGIQPTQAAEWGYDIQRAISDAGASTHRTR